MSRRLRNHPGWGKGAEVLIGGTDLAVVLEDGRYIDGGDCGLWHYKVQFENGRVDVHIPLTSDVLVKAVDRWRPEHVL